MKRILSIVGLALVWSCLVQAAPQSYYDYRDGSRYLCQLDEEAQKETCVKSCTARDSNGSCYRYGPDYCASGRNISCVSRCTARDSNGTCYRYDQDLCGDDVSCSRNCTARDSDGNCYRYGADRCG